MTVLAHSLDGCLRIRALKRGRAVVEIRSHLIPNQWAYCVWRVLPEDRAWAMFDRQCKHHVDASIFTSPVVQPGV